MSFKLACLIGAHLQDGTAVEHPIFPFKLRFHPAGKIQFPNKYRQPLTDLFASIEEGTVLYEIFALNKPEQLNGMEMHIGNRVTTSRLVPCLWGDKHLFFRHQDMLEDLKTKPEWEEFVPSFKALKNKIKCH